jgi:hypothetical protein
VTLPRELFVLTLVGAALTSRPARADDMACIGASESSLALRKQGKLRDALKQLAVCADTSCPAEVRTECARRVDDVRAAIPTLILAMKDSAGNDVLGATARIDGEAAIGLDGRPVSIDPGEHTLVFEAPGQPPVEKKLVVHEAEKDRRETATATGPGPATAAPPPPGLPALPVAPQGSSWSTSKTLAIVAAGLGVVGVGVGTGLGLAAISSKNQEKTDCPSAGCPGPNHAQAVNDYNSAHSDGTISTIGFAAGAGLIAVGAVLWFTAPSHTEQATLPLGLRFVPVVGAGSGGIVVDGVL